MRRNFHASLPGRRALRTRDDRTPPRRPLLWSLALAVLSLILPDRAHGQAVGTAVGPARPAIPGVDEGAVLLGELNCTACHPIGTTQKSRVLARSSPLLGESGLRITPQYLRAFLSDPQKEKPGTTMPDLFAGLTATEKVQAVDALVQFLASQTPTNSPPITGADRFQIQQGRMLFHRAGCVACHAPQEEASALAAENAADEPKAAVNQTALNELKISSVPLGNLAKKTTVDQLSRFLQDPLKIRPSGRMPSLNLSAAEATAIAMYLLRDQAGEKAGGPPPRIRGLAWHYYEGQFTDTKSVESRPPKASGLVDHFTLPPHRRKDNVGFRFSGFVSVPADGEYQFYTASDDGSTLYIGDTLVVENDGVHGATEKKGSIQLAAGEHPIRVVWFNEASEASLKVAYAGPGFKKREIPPAALSTDEGVPMLPVEEEKLVSDPDKASRGRELFTSLGCAACHTPGGEGNAAASQPKAKPLLALDPRNDRGCLGDRPGKGVPQYRLTATQRSALQSTLAAHEKLSLPLDSPGEVLHTMVALNCFACHSRDGTGGPAPGRADYFTVIGGADLGDEGRLPPHLTRVGDKLRPDWLRDVLLNKGTARPYMATRMPQFGPANVGPLIAAFKHADASGNADNAADSRDASYGRKLVGVGGFSCISCHTFAGHKSLGIPAMDLSLMTRRLQWDWFRRYLLEPSSLRPGTRMPAFWPEGKSARQDILDGNTDRQIKAIWAYLAKGKDGGLPDGLIKGKIELAATNDAVIYRNFIEGAGSRAIGVGYPERANLAFDANDLRLAMLWQGPFIDAAKHRDGRGAGFEGPLGYNILKMPAGPPFAILADADGKWPDAAGKRGGYQMQGYRLDEKRRPAFLYSFQNVRIQDYPVAVAGELEAGLRRTLTLRAEPPVDKLWFRAWSGSNIEEQPDHTWLGDGKVRLQLTPPNGARPVVRQSEGRTELLVPVVFKGGEATIVEDINW